MTDSWKEYYKKIGNAEPRPLLVEALHECKEKKLALDIGAGSMADTVYLLYESFKHVIAVDSSPSFMEIASTITSDNLTSYNIPIEKYQFTSNYFDIINAQFSIPFIGKEHFNEVWENIQLSLKSGGVFCGQLFGDKDTWNTPDSLLIFQTKEEVSDLISSFEVLKFKEVENDGLTAAGSTKHWHIFNLILRKK